MTDPSRDVEELRRALREQADTIVPVGDGLERIRARTAARRMSRRWAPVAALAGAAAVAGIGWGAVVIGGDNVRTETVTPATTPSSSPSAPPSSPAASATPSPEPTPSSTAIVPAPPADPTESGASGSAVLPVYFAGEHDGRWWLYREFRRLPVTDGAVISAAVSASLAGEASDPDYGTRWPGVQLLGVARDGDVVTVEVSGPSAGPAELAAQQLVYTVTATDPTVGAVRLIGPGVGSPGDAAVSRAPQQNVVAPVWIIEPGEGATLDGPVTVSGDASVLEANVSLEVRQGDRVVEQSFATATKGAPGRGTWEATFTLPPGDYEIWAYESSLEDGSVQFPDTRRVTVR